MNDDELILKYKKYLKKRNLIIVIFLLLICFVTIVGLFYKSSNPEQTEIPNKEDVPIPEQIDKAPVLELTESEITIEVNNEIDYMSYLKSAIDEVDGDLKEKVQYSTIDTSKAGEYKILYYVFDSSNNVTQAFLKVLINDPPKQEETENKDEPTNSTPSVGVNNSSTQSGEESKPSQNTPVPSQKPSTKYFLFEDGYTITNVVDACAKELKSYDGSGRCEPITDENGIYLGMKLEYE